VGITIVESGAGLTGTGAGGGAAALVVPDANMATSITQQPRMRNRFRFLMISLLVYC
jgi:hypothetical protein